MPTTPSRRIEAIEPDARQPEIVRIVIGGRTVMTAPRDALVKEGLAVGADFSEGHQARLATAAELSATRRTALASLERRSFARRDLARKLVLKGHRPAVVETVLHDLEAAGLVNDAQFAEHYVETRAARGRGPARLKKELLKVGVPAEHIDAAMAKHGVGQGDARDLVEKLVVGRLPRLAGLPRATAKRRLIAFLSRQGYGGSVVLEVVRAHLGSWAVSAPGGKARSKRAWAPSDPAFDEDSSS